MYLTQLRYFIAVVESGSLTAAAKILGVSQPALSVAMTALEDRLGTKLLMRSRGGVQVSATGQVLFDEAREIFERIHRAEMRVKQIAEDLSGQFVLGCHESLGSYFLPSFFQVLMAQAPQIELSIANDSSAKSLDAVLARRVDMALVVNPESHPDLVLVKLFDDAVDFFIRQPQVQTDIREEDAWARIKEGPLIYAHRISQMQMLLSLIQERNMMPSRLLTCGDLELVKSLALAGIGVALLPRRVAAYNQPGTLLRLHPSLPNIPDVISLVFRADTLKTKAFQMLKDLLIAHGRGQA